MMHRHLYPTLLGLILIGCGGDSGEPSSGASAMVPAAGEGQFGPAGTALTDSLAVLVTDGSGSPLAGVVVHWNVSTGGGSVSPASAPTGADGIARTRRILGANAGPQTTNATLAGVPNVTFHSSAEIAGAMTIAAAATAPFTDTVLGTLGAGENRIAVVLTDHAGDPVAGAIVHWTAGGGGSVSAPTSVTDPHGKATIDYTFGATTGGGFTAQGSVTGLVGSPVTFSLTATPGVPTGVTRVTDDSAVTGFGGTLLQSVAVRDGHGNGVAGIAIQWAASSGGGSVTPTTTTTPASGVTSTTRTLGPTEAIQKTTATATGLPGTPGVEFTIRAVHLITVRNDFFTPSTATISAGESVIWSFQGGSVTHNVTFAPTAGAPANIPNQTSGQFTRLFTTPGTYNFECTIHAGMTGSVVVE